MVNLSVVLGSLAFLALSVSGFEFDLDAGTIRCFTEEIPQPNLKLVGTYDLRTGESPDLQIELKAMSPGGAIVYSFDERDQIKPPGKFGLMADAGFYQVCFQARVREGAVFRSDAATIVYAACIFAALVFNLVLIHTSNFTNNLLYTSLPFLGLCLLNTVTWNVYRDLSRRVKFSLATGVDTVDYAEVARDEDLQPLEMNLRKMEDTVKQVHEEMLYMKTREKEHRDTNEVTNTRVAVFSIVGMLATWATAFYQVTSLKKYFQQKKLI